MAKIHPFRGVHYNIQTVPDLSAVITPPYDNISSELEKDLRDRSPYNFSHVDLPNGPEDDYSNASALLGKWQEHKILVTDASAGYYWYRQTFTDDGVKHHRDALVCAVELSDFSQKIIRPHENTHGQPKEDRLRSLRGTGFNLSHIFAMVKDPEGVMASAAEKWEFQTPIVSGTTDDGALHAVWKIDATNAAEIEAFFDAQPIYIVDGHHRYESALAFARETGALGDASKPASTALFTICNAFDPGLVVRATHRAVADLGEAKPKLLALADHFDMTEVDADSIGSFTQSPVSTPSFMAAFGDKVFSCTPKAWDGSKPSAVERLATHWSDRHLLTQVLGMAQADFGTRIVYEKDAARLWAERSRYDLILFHARPKTTDVTDVADEGSFMPPKSTYFFPKLASGLVLRAL